MAKQIKNFAFSLADESTFSAILSKIKSSKSSGLKGFRQILSPEKARLLHICKTKQPDSIYMLAKILGRDFKAVLHDVKLLEQFGFIELVSSYKQGRERFKPIVEADQIVVTITI